MATLNPYLNFYGKCNEAMNFYKEIFGGELSVLLAGDSPAKDQMPQHLHSQVMHSHLKSNAIEISRTEIAMRKPARADGHHCAIEGSKTGESFKNRRRRKCVRFY